MRISTASPLERCRAGSHAQLCRLHTAELSTATHSVDIPGFQIYDSSGGCQQNVLSLQNQYWFWQLSTGRSKERQRGTSFVIHNMPCGLVVVLAGTSTSGLTLGLPTS